jgi:hypothetical protein
MFDIKIQKKYNKTSRITPEILSHGYLHSSTQNFVSSYENLGEISKYEGIVDKFITQANDYCNQIIDKCNGYQDSNAVKILKDIVSLLNSNPEFTEIDKNLASF